MRTRTVQRLARLLFLTVSLACGAVASARSLLLISIDGLPPRYVTDADALGLKIPILRSFVSGGAYARGVVGVMPTLTYPNHTTIVSGVSPAEHGIISNTFFDPTTKNRDGWYWYAEDIRVPTLWSVAHAAGLKTSTVNWPVTVGDTNIDLLLPEFWRTSQPDDLKLLRALARPEGYVAKLEAKLGPFIDGYTDTLASDEVRTRFALEVLRRDKPQVIGVHLIALDGTEHRDGPYTPTAFEVLEALDRMIGELSAAALANDPEATIAIVSDHGFIKTHTAVSFRTRFAEAGLIKLESGTQDAAIAVESWDAQIWPGGGLCAVVLKDRANASARQRVKAVLDAVASDSRKPIARILTAKEIAAAGAFPDADFVVELAPGFLCGTAFRGDLFTTATSKGTHGYVPEREEMHASFFIKGPGIATRHDLGVIDMRQIAPTFARLLGVSLPTARHPPLPLE